MKKYYLVEDNKLKGDKNGMFNKHHSVEAKKKISETMSIRRKEMEWPEIKHTEKFKQNRSEEYSKRRWMNDGVVSKFVMPNEIDNYLKGGFTFGRIKWKT